MKVADKSVGCMYINFLSDYGVPIVFDNLIIACDQ